MSRNPLLDRRSLPPFGEIATEHVEPAVTQQLEANRSVIRGLLAAPSHSFASLVEPMERLQHSLNRTWSPVSHLNGVMNNPPLRAAYTACLSRISEYQTELGQNETLYRHYAAIAERERDALDASQRQLLQNALRDFRLAGVGLEPARKARFKELMRELARDQAKFEENVLDSANSFSRAITDAALLEGLPEVVVARARATARERGFDGWLLTLDQPTNVAVLTHARTVDCGANSTRRGRRAPPTADRPPAAGTIPR